ncbi:MAG: hypothetical protein AABW71_01845 [Nanoarchaeota archaeon]
METNEFLGFIIAVIGVVLLGFFGIKLYNFFVDADMKNAQVFVNDLSGKIEFLKDGESNNFALRGMAGWVLVGWNKDVPIAKDDEIIGKDRKPQKCFDKACLCLCEKSITQCQDVGFCREIDRNIDIKSDGFVDYSIAGGSVGPGGGFSLTKGSFSLNCIYFNKNNLKSLFVEKQKTVVNIKFNEGNKYQSDIDYYIKLKGLGCSFTGP